MDNVLNKYLKNSPKSPKQSFDSPAFNFQISYPTLNDTPKMDYYFSHFVFESGPKSEAESDLNLSLLSVKEIEADYPLQHFRQLISEVRKKRLEDSDTNKIIENQVFLKRGSNPISSALKTLVLNLTDTFFHRVADPNEPYDLKVLEKDGTGTTASSLVRFAVGFGNLLQILSQEFELIVFDSSPVSLLNQVLAHIDPEGAIFSHVIYSSSGCGRFSCNKPFRDLRVLLNRKLQDIWYLSSSFDIPFVQIGNFVPILPSRFIQTEDRGKDVAERLFQFVRNQEPSATLDPFGLRQLSSLPEVKEESIRDYLVSRSIIISKN